MASPAPVAPSTPASPALAVHTGLSAWLLNIGHALDHLVLLIFATAVGTIAADFGAARWEDLMPFATGAFVMFGLGALPAGRLGDLWGRRAMMQVFFFGLGVACLIAAMTQTAWQMAGALALLGLFAAIYHPVGIPMLLQGVPKPGQVIGLNGLAGNMGIAIAALSTGLVVKYIGWRFAFVLPGLVAIACGIAFSLWMPRETQPPARRTAKQVPLDRGTLARVFLVLTLTSTAGSLVFNFTTNGNSELLRERMAAVTADPALLGTLLAVVYAIASLAQIVVGHLIDRIPIKRLFMVVVAMQIPLFLLAASASGWALFALAIAFMVFVFGAIPFTDALIVRFVDDRMRSRVAGMRLTVAFGVSALAVYLLGPVVKAGGFGTLLVVLALISAASTLAILALPSRLPGATPSSR